MHPVKDAFEVNINGVAPILWVCIHNARDGFQDTCIIDENVYAPKTVGAGLYGGGDIFIMRHIAGYSNRTLAQVFSNF